MTLRQDVDRLSRRVQAIAPEAIGERPSQKMTDDEFHAWFEKDPMWATVWMISQVESDASRAWIVAQIEDYMQALYVTWLTAIELCRSGVEPDDVPARIVSDYHSPRYWTTLLYGDQPGPIEWTAADAERILLCDCGEQKPTVSLLEALSAMHGELGPTPTGHAVLELLDLKCFVDACEHMHETDSYIRQLDASRPAWARAQTYNQKPRPLRPASVAS